MTKAIHLADDAELRALLGDGDEVLKTINAMAEPRVTARGHEVRVEGEGPQSDAVYRLLESMASAVRKGHALSAQDAEYLLRRALTDEVPRVEDLLGKTVLVSEKGRRIRPRTLGQLRYVEAIEDHGVTFCIGPAGTGKTYLAMGLAVAALNEKQYQRLILSRPAVEAGESLGFLPGDLREKVDPYLRPLYDALYDMMRMEKAQRLLERGTIEVVPLAYMRGRTLNDAFIILDEAQNTTEAQMKMFLTRMGYSSKIVVTGDVTQVDLPAGRRSGLGQARQLLADVEGIAHVDLGEEDVVRHPLVRRIIRAYDAAEERSEESHAVIQ
ncbi:MAG: AAA family ATPase [Armatimonadia bacterium]|nr:AAA family ATPase [Armatimonadia bacterium]